MAESPRWKLIGRGFAGWHADGINVSSSGGQLEPYTYWTGQACAGYAAEAEEGALVYDASTLEATAAGRLAFTRHVLTGPMVRVDMDPDDWSKMGHDDPTPHAFDYVGIARYERLLRALPGGVRFGHVRNGIVEWEETVDTAPATAAQAQMI